MGLPEFYRRTGEALSGVTAQNEADVTALIEEGGRVAGARAETPEGGLTVHADLVVGADGRHSTVRASAGLETIDLGASMDGLWMRLSRRPPDPEQTSGADRRRQDACNAQPRGLLAMRICDRERRVRTGSPGRPGVLS